VHRAELPGLQQFELLHRLLQRQFVRHGDDGNSMRHGRERVRRV
jgi:hypothetical protein